MLLQKHFTIQGKEYILMHKIHLLLKKMVQIEQDLPYDIILPFCALIFYNNAGPFTFCFMNCVRPVTFPNPPHVDSSPVAAELGHCEHGPHSLFTCELSPAAAQPRYIHIFCLTFVEKKMALFNECFSLCRGWISRVSHWKSLAM